VFLLLFNRKRGWDSKGAAWRRQAKNHPVNGFLAPRAGGGTGPVPPGIPPSPPKAKGAPEGVPFAFQQEERVGFEGCGLAQTGKKPSGEWFFSTPGWRRRWPSAAGNPTVSAKYKRNTRGCSFCILIRERRWENCASDA